MHQCTLAVECIHVSVVLSGMGVLGGGWFLHRIGISIINSTLCFLLEIQTIIQTSASLWFVFDKYFQHKTKSGLYHTAYALEAYKYFEVICPSAVYRWLYKNLFPRKRIQP